MPTPYEKIYENLLSKFRDYEIPMMSEEEVEEYLHDYLSPAITRFHVCRNNLRKRNNTEFEAELTDMEIEILSNYMLLEYIDSTYIRTSTLLKVSLPSSDFHAFSSANMLDKLMDMHKTYLKENETLLSRYAWLGLKTNKVSLKSNFNKKY